MIPVCEPLIGEKELEYAIDCIKAGWISSQGKYIRKFEEKFAAYCGCKYGIATTSGTTALHLAVASLGLQRGDEVIVPAFTNAASAFAVVYCGAVPIFIDAELETWNIDTSKIEPRITKRTRAIMPVHIYGHPCDMDPIIELAERYGLSVIEDAAEAHGAEYRGRKVGGIGDVGCFSFYGNKIITTGEGGMIVTNSAELAEKARVLKNLAFSPERRFLHYHIGFNYRMTNVQAAVGLAQFERIDKFIEMRRHNAHRYHSLLGDIKGIRLPVEKEWARNVYWMYSIVIEDDFGLTRDELMARLTEKGIETRTFFIPMDQQPVFREMGINGESCPVAGELSRKGLYLPSGSGLLPEQIEYICRIIREIKGTEISRGD
ncbi:MAG: hypothetical protein A2144_03880 [Chloroflexi bacterium RBG_16_50_9]|nr:MAG: hypothetical protein A2144_03880 [Chloroflexi bacterium RBG_16_50_9]